MIRTAITLARRGLAVFPCRPRDKRPATANGCKDATTDLAIIRQWWLQEPTYNIGIATGATSKVFALDIDGLDAETELRKLEATHGSLPATVEVITGRDCSRHIYFQMPDAPMRNSVGKIAPGIDVRADGGYTLAPPSIHPTGKAYCWSVDSANAFAAAPEWLLAKANGSNGNGAATLPSVWRDLACDGFDEGARNDGIARLAGYLLRHRIDPVVALEMLASWNAAHCRPPLDEKELATIVDSIAGRELKRRGAA